MTWIGSDEDHPPYKAVSSDSSRTKYRVHFCMHSTRELNEILDSRIL